MKIYYFLAALIVFLSIHGFLMAKAEPVATYFFVFVWWSYIFLIDGFLFWRTGTSLLVRLKVKFLLLVLGSACLWIFFEILNLRIANWHYSGPSLSPTLLIIFGLLAFGSVLPGILETHEFLQFLGLGRRLKFLGWERSNRFFAWEWWGRPRYLWMAIGFGMIVLVLLWPRYFFWMIWGAVIFLVDPQVEKKGGNSIFAEVRKGKIRTFYRLLLTGLICGALWEGWNYWAGLKWHYTVPLVGEWKIFEMPVLGYFGFSFFAIECYVLWEWIRCQGKRTACRLQKAG